MTCVFSTSYQQTRVEFVFPHTSNNIVSTVWSESGPLSNIIATFAAEQGLDVDDYYWVDAFDNRNVSDMTAKILHERQCKWKGVQAAVITVIPKITGQKRKAYTPTEEERAERLASLRPRKAVV